MGIFWLNGPIRRRMSKIKQIGCQACPLGDNKEQNFIAPNILVDAELIVLFSVHDKDGNQNPDLSAILDLVEKRLRDRKAIFIGSQQCWGDCSLKSLKACKEAYIQPTLETFPTLPILVLGEKAAHVVLGYKAAMIGKNGMAGKVLEIDGHDMYFTYSSMENREHISIMLDSMLGEMPEFEWTFGMPPEDFWEADYIVMDLEHSDTNPYLGGKIDCIGISGNNSDTVYCVLHGDFDILKKELTNYSGILVGHNFSSDLMWLRSKGFTINPAVKIWDTMIHQKLRPDAPERGFGLKYLLKKYYSCPGYESRVHGFWHRGEIPALEDLAKYNAMDVLGTQNLYDDQQSDKRNANQFYLAMDYVLPMVELMHNGIHVSPEKLKNLGLDCEMTIGRLKKEIAEIVGCPVEFGDEEDEQLADRT
jgi:hypothetical protein